MAYVWVCSSFVGDYLQSSMFFHFFSLNCSKFNFFDIWNRGDEASLFYVILEGSIGVFIRDQTAEEVAEEEHARNEAKKAAELFKQEQERSEMKKKQKLQDKLDKKRSTLKGGSISRQSTILNFSIDNNKNNGLFSPRANENSNLNPNQPISPRFSVSQMMPASGSNFSHLLNANSSNQNASSNLDNARKTLASAKLFRSNTSNLSSSPAPPEENPLNDSNSDGDIGVGIHNNSNSDSDENEIQFSAIQEEDEEDESSSPACSDLDSDSAANTSRSNTSSGSSSGSDVESFSDKNGHLSSNYKSNRRTSLARRMSMEGGISIRASLHNTCMSKLVLYRKKPLPNMKVRQN